MAASPAQITLARLTEGGIVCLVDWLSWISGSLFVGSATTATDPAKYN